MHGKVCIVTGANTGIGYEIARGLLERGATVILGCRDLEKGEKARATLVESTGNSNAKLMMLDLSNVARTKNFATKFEKEFQRLDLLVNNAGVWPKTRRKTVDGFELTFAVNHLGHFFLTQLLRPMLEKSAPSRVVVLTTSLALNATIDFDDLMFKVRKHNNFVAYSQSKLANQMFTLAHARRLEGKGVAVNAVHPGVVATEITRESQDRGGGKGKLTPRQGAEGPLLLATSPELEGVSGRYFDQKEQKHPSALAQDRDAQEKLWAMSLSLLKLPPENA